MAVGVDKYNMIQMLNRELERNIKEAVVDRITKLQMEEFEAKIRPMIKKEVDKMTFNGIDQMYDYMQVRDEFRLYIQWSDEEEPHIEAS